MKTIIISDIKSEKDSIITYGLNLAKFLETEVDVIHPVDSRVNQGQYSSFSDSQSVTPGNTFTQKEILYREKEGVKKDLDKLLSAETSRLNYPLKVNVVVEEASIDEAIKRELSKNKKCIFVANSEPDGNIFLSKSEILETLENSHANCLMVPAGTPFTSIHKILVPTDFQSSDVNIFSGLHTFLNKLNPSIVAVDVAEKGNFAEKELKGSNWKEIFKNTLNASKINTIVLEGKNYNDTIADYCKKNIPDLLLISQRVQNPLKQIFSKKGQEEIFFKVNVPVLIHFY